MEGVTGGIMLGVVTFIFARGACKGADAYGAFLRGAERGMHSAFSLLPALCGMLLMLGVLRASGLTELATRLAAPALAAVNIPKELTPLLLLRPLTGSGSLAALEEIFLICGVDSRAGRMASVLMGSSETIFYTMTVYAGAAGVKRLPGVMTAALTGYGVGIAACALLIR